MLNVIMVGDCVIMLNMGAKSANWRQESRMVAKTKGLMAKGLSCLSPSMIKAGDHVKTLTLDVE